MKVNLLISKIIDLTIWNIFILKYLTKILFLRVLQDKMLVKPNKINGFGTFNELNLCCDNSNNRTNELFRLRYCKAQNRHVFFRQH